MDEILNLIESVSEGFPSYFLVSKYNVGKGALLLHGLSEPEFCGDLVYGFGEVVGKYGFPCRFGGGGDYSLRENWL